MSKRRRFSSTIVMVDLSMTLVLTLLIMLFLAFQLVNPKAKKQDPTIPTDGAYIVVMEWPKESDDDVDLYVRDPRGTIVYFGNQNAELLHLERDDTGRNTDRIQTSKGLISVDKNEERTVLRAAEPGSYTVNVHMFAKRAQGPTSVTVSLYCVKAGAEPVVRKSVELTMAGAEQTAFSFTVTSDDKVTDVNTLPDPFIGRTQQQLPGGL